VILPLIAAISFALFTYIYFGISKEAVWRAEVFGHNGHSLKEKTINWISRKSSSGLKTRLDRIGVPVSQYVQQGTLMVVGTGIVFGFAGGSVLWGIIGALLVYGIHFLRYYNKYKSWRDEILSEVGNLASFLKIRLIVGDTVSQSIPKVLPVIHGAIAVAWSGLVAETAAGMSLPEALDRLADKVNDRDMSAILLKLKTYHREGIPKDHLGVPDPFGDMAEKIERSSAKRVKYFTKRLTGPLTLIAGVGFITCSLWLIPYFWQIISSSLSQM
jgi:Flp pilus assembly protein TadB